MEESVRLRKGSTLFLFLFCFRNSAEPVEKALPRFMSPYTPSTDSSSPLKPPPSCINFERKTIKLNSRSSATSPESSPSPKTINNGNKSSPDSRGSNNKTPQLINKTIESPMEDKNTLESKRPAEDGEKVSVNKLSSFKHYKNKSLFFFFFFLSFLLKENTSGFWLTSLHVNQRFCIQQLSIVPITTRDKKCSMQGR